MKKNTKLLISLTAVLVVFIAAAIALPSLFSADTEGGTKTVTFTVVYDGKETDYTLKTDAQYLGEAVYEKGLVTKQEFDAGFYTVIDGITADWNTDGAWWCITENGAMTNVGMNELPIEDGDSFEASYTVD